MAKVNQAWRVYLVMWGLFGLADLLLRYMTGSDLLDGVGISLVFIAGGGLLVAGFAERRTHSDMNVLQGRVAATGTR